MRIIASEADIAEGLAFLQDVDPRLRPVVRIAGTVPLRRRPAGFAGLARIIVGQQLSIASADAIWNRLLQAFPECRSAAIDTASDDALRAAGLSAAKIRTLRAAAHACRDGLDLVGLAKVPIEDAHRQLKAIKGIGPWSADIYLLFCLGHADVFPAGDLALRNALADCLERTRSPTIEEAVQIAAAWSPWRGVAARLLWAYYRVCKERAAVPG